MRAFRLLGVIGALVLLSLVWQGTASAARPRRPRLVGAELIRQATGGEQIMLRWSQAVRVVRPGGIHFLTPTRVSRYGRLLSRRHGRTQGFAVASGIPFEAVRARAGVARGRGGPSRRGRVRIVRVGTVGAPAGRGGGGPGSGSALTPSGSKGSAPPPLASAFIDSIGMNTHFNYSDTPYANASTLQGELVKLGVHHVRDAACVSCTQERQALLALAQAGIKTDFGVGPPGGREPLSEQIAMLDGPMNQAVASIEGPNEYDSSGDPNWVANLRAYQQDLYQQVEASPHLAGIPVLGPSMGDPDDYASLGDLTPWLDEGNIHPYPSDQLPETNLVKYQDADTAVASDKPVTVTEIGYNNALSTTSRERPVSEAAASAYIPRTFLDFFRAGMVRTYLYELIDEQSDPNRTQPEAEFGLLRHDYSEKPAYGTLHALIGAVAPTQAGSFPRSSLSYTINPGSIARDLLLQTGADTYALVLWRDVSVWDSSRGQDVAVTPESISVAFGPEVTSVTERFLDGSPPESIARSSPDQPVTISLAGMPVVLELQRSSG